MKKVRIKKRFYVIMITLLVLIVGTAMLLLKMGETPMIPVAEEKPDPIEISITCAGDIVIHKPNLEAQYDRETDTYNFDDNFAYIKPYIEEADLALCTIETTFAGEPYQGYPMFKSPDALATSLKNAGFDMIMTSSNHAYDAGLNGMTRTVDVLRENGLIAAGTRATTEEPRYAMAEVKGIKIAMIAYTYETGSASDPTTYLNANPLSDEAAALVNSFQYDGVDRDVEEMKVIATEARAAGADLVLMYFHWGEEYQLESNSHQENLANLVANQVGADMVFASHPHVPQSPDVITVTNEDSEGVVTEKKVPVFYAMGNFLSNQRRELIPSGGRYVEQGYLARTTVTFDGETKQVISIDSNPMPYWVDKYTSGGKVKYAIVPLDENYRENPALLESGHLDLASEALGDVNEILGIK